MKQERDWHLLIWARNKVNCTPQNVPPLLLTLSVSGACSHDEGRRTGRVGIGMLLGTIGPRTGCLEWLKFLVTAVQRIMGSAVLAISSLRWINKMSWTRTYGFTKDYKKRSTIKLLLLPSLHEVASFVPKLYAGLIFFEASWPLTPVRLGRVYLAGPGPKKVVKKRAHEINCCTSLHGCYSGPFWHGASRHFFSLQVQAMTL